MRWTGSGWKLLIGAVAVALVSVGATAAAMLAGRKPARPLNRTLQCRPIAEIVGPEDIEMLDGEDVAADRRVVFVSATDRRQRGLRGAIWRIPLDKNGAALGKARRLPLRERDRCSFRPHGIAVLRFGVSTPLLYVINRHHARDWRPSSGCLAGAARPEREAAFSSIEVFSIEQDELKFRHRLGHAEHLPNPNDLAIAPDGKVYVTNPATGVAGLGEGLQRRNWKSTVARYRPSRADDCDFCDGVWTKWATVGAYANGIALSSDGGDVFVASSADGRIWRLPAHDPKHMSPLDVGPNHSGADNLSWHSRAPGVLVVAAHPDLRRFLQHSLDARVSSPSEVWAIDVTGKKAPALLWSDDGAVLSGSSSAAIERATGALLVGQVFGRHVLRCERREAADERRAAR